MQASSQRSSARSASASTTGSANTAGVRFRASPSSNGFGGALSTTWMPARFAASNSRPSTFTAEKSKPETAARSSSRQSGRGGFQHRRDLLPTGSHAHQGHGGQAHGAADAGHETRGHGIGDETQQIREPETPDQQAGNADDDGAEDERSGGCNEQRFALGTHGPPDDGHADHERRRERQEACAAGSRYALRREPSPWIHVTELSTRFPTEVAAGPQQTPFSVHSRLPSRCMARSPIRRCEFVNPGMSFRAR